MGGGSEWVGFGFWGLVFVWSFALGPWSSPATAAPKNILPIIADDISAAWTNGQFSCTVTQAANCALWRCDNLITTFWSQVTNAVATTNGTTVTLKDVTPPAAGAFYSVVK